MQNKEIKLKNIVIIDTETGGLDPTKHSIIELAAIFYNVPTNSVISQVSLLYPVDANAAYCINKINIDTTQEMGHFTFFHATKLVQQFIEESDAIVAHNAQFDKKFVDEWTGLDYNDKPWICTCRDIDWPPQLNLRKRDLTSLALSHKIPVWQQHRALTDCIYLSQILSKYNGKLSQLLKTGLK